jgi:hypothetical protein
MPLASHSLLLFNGFWLAFLQSDSSAFSISGRSFVSIAVPSETLKLLPVSQRPILLDQLVDAMPSLGSIPLWQYVMCGEGIADMTITV